MSEYLTPQLRQAVAYRRTLLNFESDHPDDKSAYEITCSSLADYSKTFASVVRKTDAYRLAKIQGYFAEHESDSEILASMLRWKQSRLRRQPRYFDAMSYGLALNDSDLSGLALALESEHGNAFVVKKSFEERPHQRRVIGNMLASGVWSPINADVRENGYYDLITCTPYVALWDVPPHDAIYGTLFNKFYDVLSPDEGLFLTQHNLSTIQKKRLMDGLKEVPGIIAAHTDYEFFLMRIAGSPASGQEVLTRIG